MIWLRIPCLARLARLCRGYPSPRHLPSLQWVPPPNYDLVRGALGKEGDPGSSRLPAFKSHFLLLLRRCPLSPSFRPGRHPHRRLASAGSGDVDMPGPKQRCFHSVSKPPHWLPTPAGVHRRFMISDEEVVVADAPPPPLLGGKVEASDGTGATSASRTTRSRLQAESVCLPRATWTPAL